MIDNEIESPCFGSNPFASAAVAGGSSLQAAVQI